MLRWAGLLLLLMGFAGCSQREHATAQTPVMAPATAQATTARAATTRPATTAVIPSEDHAAPPRRPMP